MGRTLTQQIRKVIREHYGEHLSSFRDDVNYNDGTKSFVRDLARMLKGEIKRDKDWGCDLAKYSRADSIDAELGKRLRIVRLQKDVTLQDLAKKINMHPAYLDAIENGTVVTLFDKIIDIARALKVTKKDSVYILDGLIENITLKQRIKDVIELYYGKNLWYFRPEVGYEESIIPFIKSLAELVEPEPPFGYMAAMVDGERKVVSDPIAAPIVRRAFEKELQPVA
ncbi:MAG TPA: helix-turn-helix transcriptional regulator [Candidatus Saccharimonadales bacterium]|nr:helix-turn-helix transcriptional regulator [Candidatus Saccharimonadales bacterium]